jgi:hypothetical protein
LLVRTPTAVLSSALACGVTLPPQLSQVPIPAGNSWFAFDLNTYLCSRFAIVYPTPPASYPWNANALSQLQKIITTWRPCCLCVGVFVVTAGRMWDWPVSTWDGTGGNWDTPSTVVQVLQQF